MYKVIVTPQVLKYLDKLPIYLARKCILKIDELSINKKGYAQIGIAGSYELRELRVGPYRIYYLVENKMIIVDLISYDGSIEVTDIGTKDQQKRQIAYLKKKY